MNTDSHYSSALDYSSLLNPFTQGSLDPILNQVTTTLGSFSSSDLAFNQISRAFGISDENAIDSILFRLHQGDPSLLGNVSVLDDAAMNGARGAYATPQDRIYLSQSLLTNGAGTHSDPLTGVAAVIIEEIGHRIDALLNPGSDTIGDEGELFKNLVLGVALTEDELARIQGEDDTGSITVNGVEIAVEQDNALSTARAITVGSSTTTYRDWVGSADTNDYYRFTLGNTSNFNLSLTGLTADADVQLLNSSGTVIRSSNNSGSSSESITQQLAAGTYYARVLPYGSSSTYYNLNLSATPITTVTIAATDPSAAETNTGQLTNPGQFTLTRTGLLTSALTANYTIGGTATNGSDYSGLTGSITFAAGSSTARINLNVINDSLIESSETVTLTLAGRSTISGSSAYQIGSSSTATATIADNDTPIDRAGNSLTTASAITVGSSTITRTDWVGSADTNDYYRFTLGNTSNFNLSLTGLTADADVQLLNSSGTVIRSSNNSGSSSESMTQQLAAGTYYARVLPYGSSSTYYNLNLSATPITTVTIAATDASAAETNTGQLTNPGQFTLTRTGLLTSALTANYTIGGTATNGSDYSGLTGSITFAAGSSTALINLNVINDSLVESSETVILTLANSSAYQIGSSSTATVTIADNDVASDWFSQNIVDVELQNLSRSRFTDGSLNRNDMIAILRDAKDGGAVTNTELTDLRRLVANWTALGMVDYVRVLSNKVVNSDAANTRSGFGNLFAGSSATQMENLIGKWFLGNDRPDTPYTYREASGSLFQNGVSYQDINQGNLGDCYLLAGLAGAAFRSPSTIQNMFIDNGDNTYTVRMYNNGVADYVTVDRFLPTFNNGGFAYASRDSGLMYNNSANELWVALAEKAYAQMNESGWISRWNNNYTNSYAAIDGGWSTDVLKQITNQNSIVDYNLTDSDRTNIINQFNAGRTVFMNWTNPEGGHALTLVGYNSTTQQFSIYNPWGFTYTLSWNQILNGGGGLPSNTIFDDWSYSA